ncbi:SulP family inorganic anion transporter [Sulfurivermis fontis]|uniref:SulP family inorganic anion transporter n=1 Tax=Sulfurivermis fontis TaxID=1972068 RepID=UPI000FD8ABA4|nr:SulP family inorganic anion transporter [Sulfurivermis fontis]
MNALAQCNLFWVKLFPFLRWWPRVNRDSVRADLLAGLTGAVIVLPQGVAFATIAGLPPEYGLYAAMMPAVIAALWGSSWHLVSGPTTAISIVVFASLSPLAEPGSTDFVRLAITLAFLVGVLQLVMALAKMGSLVNFISHSVVVGFTAGAAILIAASQIKNFFALDIPRGSHFYEIIYTFFQQLDAINPYVTAVGMVTLVTGIVARRYARRIYMIIAMLVGSLFALALNMAFGVETTGIRTVGALPTHLPPLSLPDLSLGTIKQLAPSAVAVALLAITEAVSIARSIGNKAQQRIDGNQEFIGQGLSNMVGAFFSAYPSSGSFNRSGVNFAAGAQTPLASVFAAIALALIVLLVAPLAAYLPVAAMAGILFLVAWGLIDFHHIGQIIRVSRSETTVLGATFFGALFLELEFAILLGVMLSLVFYLNRTSRPRILSRVPNPKHEKRAFTTDPALPECPQLKIMRIEGSLFFGAINHVEQAMHNVDALNPQQKHLLLVAKAINFVDLAGAEMLTQEAERRHKLGGGFYLYEVKDTVCSILHRGGYIKTIGDEHIFHSKTEALQTIINDKLDHTICRQCDKRIFRECQQFAPVGS